MRRTVRDESGVMLAIVVVMMVSLLFVVGFVIEIGNWLEHRRHAQVQVDSGALAAGTAFSGCFLEPAQANAKIEMEAHRYAGDSQFSSLYPAETEGPYNLQVDDPTRVQFALNAGAYPPGATDFAAGQPCDTRYLDVRANDIDIPSFFAGVLPDGLDFVDVTARAQVEIRKVKKLSGFLPWVVPEERPNDVIAIFIDEGSGAVRGVQPLGQGSIQQLNGEPVSIWGGNAQFMGHSQAGTGVVIATSRRPAGTVSTSGTLAQICGQDPDRVACFAGSSATSGLWYIQGFTNGTGCVTTAGPPPTGGVCSQPRLLSVTLQTATCGDNSAPYYLLHGDCNVQVRANVDFGSNPLAFPTCAKLSANGTALAYSGSGTLWTGSVTIPDLSGRNPINLDWGTWRNGGGSSCNQTSRFNGSFAKVSAPYAVDDDAGPVAYLQVTDAISGSPLGSLGTSSNSLHTTYVTVGLEPPLRVASPGDPPILLRLASRSGSRNQALDCDENQPGNPRNLADEVRDGCKTFYAVNERGEVCQDGAGGGPDWGNGPGLTHLPPPTFDPDPVPDCVALATGDVTAMTQGLKDRFETPCSPNNWATYRANGQLPPDDDPRWVTLVVSNSTATISAGQGSGVVPIRIFAGFYVTGYFHRNNGAVGCPDDPSTPVADGDDPHPNGVDPSSNRAKGDVWGYFVTNVILDINAEESSELCAFNELGVCTAVLTE